MSSSAALHTQLAAVMESLVHAAVAELKKLAEDSSAFLLSLEVRTGSTGEDPPLTAALEVDTQEKLVRSGAAGPGLCPICWTWTCVLIFIVL